MARLLIERLLNDPRVGQVVAIGPQTGGDPDPVEDLDCAGGPDHAGESEQPTAGQPAASVRPVAMDSADPRIATVFGGCDVVVHLDPDPVRQQVPRTGPVPDGRAQSNGADAATGAAGAAGADGADGADGAEPAEPGTAGAGRDGHPGDEGSGEATPGRDDLELLEPIPAGRAIRAAQTVLTAAAAAGVPTVVLVTSAMVYGPGTDGSGPADEDDPPAAVPSGPLLREMLDIERVTQTARRTHPGLAVAVLRPAALVGPGVDTLVTRHFEAPRLLTLRGAAMRWQFCHLQDLVGALVVVALSSLHGAMTVGCTGWLAQEEVERLSGLARVELPESLAFGTAERLHRLGLTPAPAGELTYVTRPWVISSARLRAAGWRPVWDNADAFAALLTEARGRVALAGRRIGRRETATLSAAGATVAVLGTAAIVRRARRARRRS